MVLLRARLSLVPIVLIAAMATSPSTPATADAVPEPHIAAVRVSPTTVTVSHLEVARVKVEVDLVSPGWDIRSAYASPAWSEGQPPPQEIPGPATLALTRGTRRDGTWTGWTAMTSTGSGRWQINQVRVMPPWKDAAERGLSAPSGQQLRWQVVGSHPPALTVQVSPQRVAPGQSTVTVTGRFYDPESGKPYSGRSVVVGGGFYTDAGLHPVTVRTDGAGRYRVRLPHRLSQYMTARAPVPGEHPVMNYAPSGPDYLSVRGFVHHAYTIKAAPDSSRIMLADPVVVRGKVSPTVVRYTAPALVELQRHSDGAWRTVATTRMYQNTGGFILTAPSDRLHGEAGIQQYRVQLPAADEIDRTVSATITVTVLAPSSAPSAP